MSVHHHHHHHRSRSRQSPMLFAVATSTGTSTSTGTNTATTATANATATLTTTTTTTATIHMPANKFGVRKWDAHGELQAEFWITDGQLTFTAGSLQNLYHGQSHTHHAHRYLAASPSTSDLILALQGEPTRPRKLGWKPFVTRIAWSKRRPEAKSLRPDSSTFSSTNFSMSMPSMQDPRPTHKRAQTSLDGTPAHEKRLSFFKRHLSHRRRPSSMELDPAALQQQPPSPTQQQQQQPRPDLSRAPASTPRSVLRRPSLANGQHQSYDMPPQIALNGERETAEDVVMYPNGLDRASSRTSKGIRWAETPGVNPPNRPRRTSSAATHGRKSSIYSKAEGDYIEGVDAGVGSKARRLSVNIPDELHVDECTLEEHFSLLARMSQKDIGEGGAAVVKHMKSKTAGNGKDRVFAVKEFRPRDPDEESEAEYEHKIKSEYAIAKSCQHANIVETFRLCHSGSTWYHVMELCELGDLNDLIKGNYFSKLDRNCMFKQLVRGVDYLHERGITHRDIKSENLLVTRDGCLKIADFGTGEVFSGMHPGLSNCKRQSIVDPTEEIRLCQPGWVGSRPYMAPEIYQRSGPYDPRAVDVWSTAIVYMTLCAGGTPWDAASPDVKNFNIYCSTWDEWILQHPDGEVRKDRDLPKFASTPQFVKLDDMGTKRMMFGMLHPDPQKRWTIRQVLETKTLTEYECCQQDGYSDDIRKRQKKALHNHVPPERRGKGGKLLSPHHH